MRMFSSLVFLLSAWTSKAQVPIPSGGYDGFFQGSRNAPIQLEAFFDLLCVDCQAAWPNIKDVIEHYKGNIGFTLHTFPLPYHTYAFIANQGLHVIEATEPSKTWDYVDLMFKNQDLFLNFNTENKSANQVRSSIADVVEKQLNVNKGTFQDGLTTRFFDEATRNSWKYACSYGMSGTPSFLVNGVKVAGSPGWQLKQWQFVLDPLLPGFKSSGSLKMTDDDTCPQNTTACEYLPGSIECCPSNEFCIPNVGCRC